MALKICQLCAVDFTLHHFLLPLIDGMHERGWNVTAVCSDGEYVPDLRARGYRVSTLKLARSFNVLSHASSLMGLIRLFRREKFDVLHAHTPVAALIGRIAGRIAGIPLIVYTAHGFYFHDEMPGWKRRIFVALERLAGFCTDLVFTQSAEDAKAAVTEKIFRADAVFAIGNGVDTARFDPARVGDVAALRRQLGIRASAPVIGLIGRRVREKGYREFLEAACMLAADFPEAVFLLVGGRLESDHNHSVEDAILEAQAVLGERLVVAGFRKDMPEMLALMDVFCLPSYREGMPRTIIEAMMMGKPVIATDIRGAREEVVAGETGWLVPTRDCVSLAAAMRSALADPIRAEAMGRAGRGRALALYNEKQIVEFQVQKILELASVVTA